MTLLTKGLNAQIKRFLFHPRPKLCLHCDDRNTQLAGSSLKLWLALSRFRGSLYSDIVSSHFTASLNELQRPLHICVWYRAAYTFSASTL